MPKQAANAGQNPDQIIRSPNQILASVAGAGLGAVAIGLFAREAIRNPKQTAINAAKGLTGIVALKILEEPFAEHILAKVVPELGND